MKQVFGVLAMLALVFGIVVGTIGYQEWSIWSQGAEEPTLITLAELEQNGPGKNHHLHPKCSTPSSCTFI